MKLGKMIKSVVVVFIGVALTDFVIHQILLKNLYMETAQLWRSPEEMKSMVGFMLSGQALVALFFTWIFGHGYKGNGMMEGVRYGLLLAGLMAGNQFMMYAVCPYPQSLFLAWLLTGTAQAVILGIIAERMIRK